MDAPPIVILGGTGAVGRHVAQFLDAQGQRVVVASRQADRAREVTDPLAHAEPATVDIGDPAALSLEHPGVVVNCTGIEDLDAMLRWRRSGWRIIDITASSTYAARLASLDRDGPAVIVGVGLIPGLTTLLARHLTAQDDEATEVVISCLLGLGEDYGDASRDWTYGQLGRRIDDPAGSFRNFSTPTSIDFPGGFGRRPAWRFDFADRVLLPPEIDVHVTTRYCFDTRLAGRALAAASAIPGARELLRRLNRLSRHAIGSTAWWAGVVETDTGRRSTALGNGQSHGTAAVTAIAAQHLAAATSEDPRYLWDLIDVADLQAQLAPAGILIDTSHLQVSGPPRS